MIKKIERLDRRLVHKGSILDVYQDTMGFEDGHTENWDFVSHRKGAAAVLPVLDDGRIILVRQQRPALERITLEIPAGCRDSLSEDTRDTVDRELKEETGYRAGKIEPLLKLRSTVAFCDEAIDVYLATELTAGEQELDPAESIEVAYFTLSELMKMIYDGTIQDAKTVAAVSAYAAGLQFRRT